MQIRPLRYWYADPDTRRPAYGQQSYITHGNNFVVKLVKGKWNPCPYHCSDEAVQVGITSGVFEQYFDRRRDAVEALEALMEGVE